MYRQLLKSSIFLLFLTVIATSCSDDPASLSSDQPPQLPPAESMNVDLSTFEGNQKVQSEAAQSSENFAQAALRALVMKTVVDINLAIPRALLTAASETEAEFNEEGEWVWSYTRNAGQETYEVRLVASQGGNNDVNWQFYVTNSQLSIDNRLFFDGTTNADGSQGTWTYYNLSSESNESVSEIQWEVTGEDQVSLRLDVTSDRFNNQGDYIEYSFDGTVKNAVYYNAGDDQTTELQWNEETKAGYIIAPNYNNGEQACWDANFEDISCS